ncbi:hypothetical protein [Microbulbifer marinus]|uniref:Peptidase M61 catalytic domain-containing protein n=1 Tax=Microbulbifer marinus TaxID=658218 RepID=A0A1H3VYW6_9GAMM|nr:hypothetical protein [Microbulbifer marinus]SDZ79996.1 hypothetical protein SAMN05216562_0404 [Microbulbifer marinus]
MLKQMPALVLPTLICLCLAIASPAALSDTYKLLYTAHIDPKSGTAHVEIELDGKTLPKKLSLNLSSGRYSDVTSDRGLELSDDRAIWRPEGTRASLSYRFAINNKKGSGSYDSRITEDWAILRSDKLIPPMSVTGKGRSKAELQLEMPEGWSSALPYPEIGEHHYRLKDAGRRFVRPKGWMIVGNIGSRQDIIAGVDTKVAAPLGEDIHRQDTLAFLNWNLPEIKEVFPKFPKYLLVVSAGDPMWRGGLSGTRSLYMHADRPMISGNRTSSMIHELVHVATGIRGDKKSDWIVEGLAEYYSLEILRRSGGISQRRYDEAMDKLADWGKKAPSLLVRRSSGPVTARAVGVMRELDREIRAASDGKASIDDVARGLAEKRGEVTLDRFRQLAEKAAGRPVKALDRDNLRDKSP